MDDAICAADFNLSGKRHRPPRRASVVYRDPIEILEELRSIETQILGQIDELGDAMWELGILTPCHY